MYTRQNLSHGLRNGRLVLCLLAAVAALSLGACSRDSTPAGGTAEQPGPARSIEEIADEFMVAYLERYPEMGTYYSIPGSRHDGIFDNSIDALQSWQAREDAWLSELASIARTPAVGSRDWVTLGILREHLEGSRQRRMCHQELWRVSQADGWQTSYPYLFEIQPVETRSEREQALARAAALEAFLDVEIENAYQGLQAGYSSPRKNVQMVIDEVRGLLGPASPLRSPASRSDDEEFVSVFTEIMDGPVDDALRRYMEFLQKEYLPSARTSIAVSALPGGEACYLASVRYYATVSRNPREIHDTGLAQIAAIRAEVQTISDEHFDGLVPEDLFARVTTDPQFTFANRDAVLAYSRDSLERARQAMPAYFNLRPKADVIVEPYPAYREAGGTGEYQSSSEDAARPGIFYIATREPQKRSIAGQQSTLYHETYPGHHMQGAIALELGDKVHPIARYLYNSGYAEGWGLYSERLADEIGLYSGPVDRLGMLSDQAARAARLVIDSGIHALGWTRQQAVDYLRSNSAWSTADIEAEIDRYIIWPGQATSYMLGMLEIRRLRSQAQKQLGNDFDIRKFHDRVLENGSITLPMLDEKISSWIKEQER